jgi:hypothetical protein
MQPFFTLQVKLYEFLRHCHVEMSATSGEIMVGRNTIPAIIQLMLQR